MTVGIASTPADALLNLYRGTSITAPAGIYIKLHTGDPGAAGTANASAVTTRNQATFNAPSGNAITLSALATYAMTATETISHVSFWDASTSGNFLRSATLSASVSVVNGSTLQVVTLTVSFTPIAA
jgi:hypothetical protein